MKPQRTLAQRLWYQFFKVCIQTAAVAWFGVRHSGRQNIPREGGVLLVANHQSHLDPPMIGIGCPRPMNFLARKTLFEIPVFQWWIRTVDAIAIDRDGIGLSGIKESLRRLKRGEVLLVFPEGTRSHDGKVGRFRPGFTSLAVRSGAAIVPVAIEGAFDAWPRSRALPATGKIHVYYGPPMLPEQVQRYEERELLAEVERRVKACQVQVRRHRDFARRRQAESGKLKGESGRGRETLNDER